MFYNENYKPPTKDKKQENDNKFEKNEFIVRSMYLQKFLEDTVQVDSSDEVFERLEKFKCTYMNLPSKGRNKNEQAYEITSKEWL